MITALYTRVSTEQQTDRDSLTTQKGRLVAYCKANEIKDFKLYQEAGKSAKDTNRPVLRELMADIRAGKVRAVVVTRLDRITRSIIDLWKLIREFREHGVSFTSLAERVDTEGPAGRFLLNILGSLAQFEREIIAVRVSESMHYRATQGKWNGGPIPYGYTTQGRIRNEMLRQDVPPEEALRVAAKRAPEPKTLCVDRAEAKVVRKIFRSYLKLRSIKKTAEQMNRAGHRTRNGARWSTASISRILSSCTYVGITCYGKRKTDIDTGRIVKTGKETWKTADGEHEGIVTDDVFKAVQEALTQTAQKPKKRARVYPLSGLLRCGKCGRTMHGYTYRKPNGKVYSYYKCPKKRPYEGKARCEGLTVPAIRLEDFVAETLSDLSRDQAFLADKEKMLHHLKEEVKAATEGGEGDLARLKKEQQDLAARREAVLDSLERRAIDDALFKERYEKIMGRLEENRLAQAGCEGAASGMESAAQCLEVSFHEISSFEKNWGALDAEGRASLLQTVVKQIDVTKTDVKLQVYLDHPGRPVEAASRMGARAGTTRTRSGGASVRRS